MQKEELNIRRRAVHIAAIVMQAAGLCRYSSFEKCRHYNATDEDCVDCIEKWLISKARKEIKRDEAKP